MKCLTEIAGVTVPHYDEKFIALFTETMTQLEGMLPVETNIKDAFKQGSVRTMDQSQQISVYSIGVITKFIYSVRMKNKCSSKTWQCSSALSSKSTEP